MQKIENLYDILSKIAEFEGQSKLSYYFALSEIKSDKDDVIIAAVGPALNLTKIHAQEYDYESERKNYYLDQVYKFDSNTYKLISFANNVHASDFCFFKGYIGLDEFYFRSAMQLNVFGKDFILVNKVEADNILLKNSFFYIYKNGKFVETTKNTLFHIRQNGIYELFTPSCSKEILSQLKQLQMWIENKNLVTEEELAYTRKHKAYLDNLAEKHKIYESADYKRKFEAMKLFQNSKSQGK